MPRISLYTTSSAVGVQFRSLYTDARVRTVFRYIPILVDLLNQTVFVILSENVTQNAYIIQIFTK